jgi:UDPglucose 6-dehydrogenase
MGMTIKIYGFGWVGKAVYDIFPEAAVHDPALGFVSDIEADVAFVCVPTPNVGEGSLDMSVVEEVVRTCPENFIVMRSTVNPGTCDRLMAETGKQIVMQPEYLGETVAHPLLDEGKRSFLIIGGQSTSRRKLIELYQTVYNANITIRQVTALEAEVIKLSENRAISFKVAQCQELYDVCELAGVDYYTVRDAVYGDDPRFNLWWTFVYPDKRGMESKCIPKDPYAWCAWAESLGYEPRISRTILEKNKDWLAQNA